MKIKSIYIDGLHNAVNKTYDLGDIVYLFGANGAGKSTVLHAIQFALLGYIPGTAKKSNEALLRHSPKNAIDVRVVLADSSEDDIVVERRVTDTGSKVTMIPDGYDLSEIVAELELPIFNFNEFVGQTANKLKEYFIKNLLPISNGVLDWDTILYNSLEDAVFEDKDEILAYGKELLGDLEGEALDQIITANARFKEELSFKKSELQRLQSTVESLIYYDDYTGPNNLAALNSDLLALGMLRDQVLRYNSAINALQSALDEQKQLMQDLEHLGGQARYDECGAELAKIQERSHAVSEVVSNHQTAAKTLLARISATDKVIQGGGVCPYTKDTCATLLAKIESLQKALVPAKTQYTEHNTSAAEGAAQLHEYTQQSGKLESEMAKIKDIQRRLLALEQTVSKLPQKPNTDKTEAELDTEIEQLTQSKSKLEANIQYNTKIEQLTKDKYVTELQLKALNAWVKKTDTNDLQTTIMEEPFMELAKIMSGYIQKMYGDKDLTAKFNISSKANSFSFGLMRNGIYIPYDLLSSGEKCLYTLALMICITNRSKSPLKLMLLDDAFDHLDPQTIENTFTTLKNIPDIQFIFAGVQMCQSATDIVLPV